MNRAVRAAFRLAVVGGALLGGWMVFEQVAVSAHPFPDRRPVPPLPADVPWVNAPSAAPSAAAAPQSAAPAARPRHLRLEDFRGKFVLLDFWTYCCINCMHVLPELKRLERAYPDALVVIGIHTGKFDAERDTANIAEAVHRLGITHPVLNDAKQEIWNRFGARAWPTLVLIDPEGQAIWARSGESTFEEMQAVLRRAVPYYRDRRLLDERPLAVDRSGPGPDSPLRFPGKVLVDPGGGRLFVADTGHHRVVVAGLDGSLRQVIGRGTPGRADGDFRTAQFDGPQGMALSGERLYVADTENHLIRRVDLTAGRVETVAGTGEPLRTGPPMAARSRPRQTAISSPWALLVHGKELYIAMAGTHQIWRLALDGSRIEPYAGNGREDIVDGPRLPDRPYELGAASFAQPSGLATDGTWLFVADSEGSSIRAVPFAPRQPVRTVVGTAHLAQGRLFTFGDVDGPPGAARLQHPLGVACLDGRLYVADTYNSKIKEIDPASGVVRTLELTEAAAGEGGEAAEAGGLDEPGGLSAAPGTLYVADTNRHRVRVIHLDRGHRVETLPIQGLAPPEPSS